MANPYSAWLGQDENGAFNGDTKTGYGFDDRTQQRLAELLDYQKNGYLDYQDDGSTRRMAFNQPQFKQFQDELSNLQRITGNPLLNSIYQGSAKAGLGAMDTGWLDALAQQAPQAGLSATSDWTGLMSNLRDKQMGQFNSLSPADNHQLLQKFYESNGLDQSGVLRGQYEATPGFKNLQSRDDAFQAALAKSNDSGAFFNESMIGLLTAMAGGAAGAYFNGGGMSGLDAGMGAYGDVSGASTAVGGSGANLADGAWGVNARGGNMLEDYFGNGNTDEFGNQIFGGQTPLGAPDAPSYGLDFGGDPLGATNNAPIPPGAMQKLVDAGVPFDVASKMTLGTLQNFLKLPGIGSSSLGSDLGKLLATGLGVVGSNQQSNQLSTLSKEFAAYGAPSRSRYEDSYKPGFTMANDAGFTDALNLTGKAAAYGQSVGGNPTGSPNAQTQIQSDIFSKFAYPALQQYRNQNAATGGIAAFNAAAPAAATGAIGSNANTFNALGAGISDIFNPKPTLAQSMADYQRLQNSGI